MRYFQSDLGGAARLAPLVEYRDLEVRQISRCATGCVASFRGHAAAPDHRVACVDRPENSHLAPHHPAVWAGPFGRDPVDESGEMHRVDENRRMPLALGVGRIVMAREVIT